MLSLPVNMKKKNNIMNLFLFIIFIYSSHLFIEKYYIINNDMPSQHGDDAAYFNTAFNINKFNVASHQVEEYRVHRHKNTIKPPLYSYFISTFMNTDKKFKDVTLECIYKKNINKICHEFVQNSKKINLAIHFFHAILLYLLIFFFTRNNYLSFVGGFFILSSTYFLNNANYFMTESFSSIFVLIHSVSFYLIFTKTKFRFLNLCITSISLGCLILTKAIFLYWFYVLFIFLLFSFFYRKLLNIMKINSPNFFYYINFNHIITFTIVIGLLIFPWQFRNFIEEGSFKISLQGGNVIAERAEYLKTDISDIKYGIIYYIPSNKLKTLYQDKLKEKSFMFDESHPNSHYRNSDDYETSYVLSKLEWSDKNKPDEVFKKSIELIKNDPAKHLYLSLMFFVRGVFQETLTNDYPSVLKFISSIVHWLSIIILPIIFLIFAIKRDKNFLLTLLSIFTIVCYSFFTDFEPRYGTIVLSTFILIFMKIINTMLYNRLNYEK
jgi:hypothetical protein